MEAINELGKKVTDNSIRLDKLEPIVNDNRIMLRGDPREFSDLGLAGALVRIEASLLSIMQWSDSLKSWGSKLALTLTAGALVWIAKNALDIYTQYLLLK